MPFARTDNATLGPLTSTTCVPRSRGRWRTGAGSWLCHPGKETHRIRLPCWRPRRRHDAPGPGTRKWSLMQENPRPRSWPWLGCALLVLAAALVVVAVLVVAAFQP